MRLYHVSHMEWSGWFTQPGETERRDVEPWGYDGGEGDFVMRYADRLWSARREGNAGGHQWVFLKGAELEGSISGQDRWSGDGVGGNDLVGMKIVRDEDRGQFGSRHTELRVDVDCEYRGMLVPVGPGRYYLGVQRTTA